MLKYNIVSIISPNHLIVEPAKEKYVMRSTTNSEILWFKALKHNNIAKMVDCNTDMIVIEYCEGGDLLSLALKGLNESKVKMLFSQAVCLVSYFQDQHIHHGNLRLDNFSVTGDTIKLTSLQTAELGYGKYDVICLGIMLYTMLTGKHFEVRCPDKAFDGPEWNKISEEAKDLTRGIVTGVFDMDDIREHPWFVNKQP